MRRAALEAPRSDEVFPVTILPSASSIATAGFPVSSAFDDYAYEVVRKLEDAGVRVDINTSNETFGYRIRQSQLSKVPYMAIVGADEAENGAVSVRARKEGDGGNMSLDAFIEKIKEDVRTFKK